MLGQLGFQTQRFPAIPRHSSSCLPYNHDSLALGHSWDGRNLWNAIFTKTPRGPEDGLGLGIQG